MIECCHEPAEAVTITHGAPAQKFAGFGLKFAVAICVWYVVNEIGLHLVRIAGNLDFRWAVIVTAVITAQVSLAGRRWSRATNALGPVLLPASLSSAFVAIFFSGGKAKADPARP
jgi:hypothetical protein